MKVLVCGGRNFADVEQLNRVLDEFNEEDPIDTLLEGGAKGAERMAGMWARNHEPRINVEVFPANWDKYGRSAGFVRNKQMLDQGKPFMVVAFVGGVGTKMMIKLARDANIPVTEVAARH